MALPFGLTLSFVQTIFAEMRKFAAMSIFCVIGAFAPGADEIPFPVVTNLPGLPPDSGLRYWKKPFERLPIDGCYVSVIVAGEGKERQWEVWQNTWGDGGATNRAIVVRKGSSLSRLGPEELVCDGTVIDDVFAKGNTNVLSPLRGFTRPFVCSDPEYGRIIMACVCEDYLPGSVHLVPALLVPDPVRKVFSYRGIARGEPRIEMARRIVWSDGGSLFRLPDGRWRMYLNGFGQVMTALESETLFGDWKFVRNEEGRPVEMLPDFPREPNRGGCFPTVLRISGEEWHAWITDTWPPQSIWHFWSRDGIRWNTYGKQPEITRAAVARRAIKCLRAFEDPQTGEIVGLLSVWVQGVDGKGMRWGLHASRMDRGPPPE